MTPVLAGAGLRRPEREAPLSLDELLSYDDHASLKLDVDPLKPKSLTTAHAGGGDDLE